MTFRGSVCYLLCRAQNFSHYIASKTRELHLQGRPFKLRIRISSNKRIQSHQKQKSFSQGACHIPIHWVIADFVVTKAAWIYAPTACSPQFTVAFVVFTAIYGLFLILIWTITAWNIWRSITWFQSLFMWKLLLSSNPPTVKSEDQNRSVKIQQMHREILGQCNCSKCITWS